MRPVRRIAEIASEQHGVFTRVQARSAGWTSKQVTHAVATGRILVLRRGVYAIAGSPPTWERGVSAAALAFGPRAVASHTTAARLLELIEYEPDVTHVTMPSGQHREPRRGIVVHQARLKGRDFARASGIPVTGAHRTVVDLAGPLSAEALEAALDEAVVSGLVSVGSLDRYIRSRGLGHNAGVANLRRLIADRRRSGTPQRELERLFIRRVRSSGLPEPRRQYPVGRYRIDFAYPESRIAVELDGLGWHFSGAAFRADRERQNNLVLAGWTPLRFTWDDVNRAWPRTEGVLRRALGLASVG